VAVAIAPHRDRLTGSDLAPRHSCLKGLRRQRGREEKEAPEFQHRLCSQCIANALDRVGIAAGKRKKAALRRLF
jgi:hypothetical protein